jgi:hypothetical protein
MYSRRLLTAALLPAAIMLGACADAHDRATTGASNATTLGSPQGQSALSSDPGRVLARVGGVPITFDRVAHQMDVLSTSGSGGPVPDPPRYDGCIARSRAAAGGSKKSESQLESGCEQRYRQLLQAGLASAIHSQWIIGEARAEGITVPISAAEREFELSRKTSFKTTAEFAAYLKKTKRNRGDVVSELWVGKLSDGIFARIHRRYRPATDAEVAAYYRKHKQQFETPPGRDVHIVRTTTNVAALRAKKQLEGGTSFASVAKRLSAIAQPVHSKNGLTRNLAPHFYSEAPLNDAIFSAKQGVISGPVFVSKPKVLASEPGSGYYVFEVIRTTPAHKTPLGQVRAEIAPALTRHNEEKTLSGSIAAIRNTWKKKTDCMPGYVVPACRQAPPAAPPRDPFQL